MADKKENAGGNFPHGALEEMLRMMRESREKGNVDSEIIMKEFMGKDFRDVDYQQIKKKLFGEDAEKCGKD